MKNSKFLAKNTLLISIILGLSSILGLLRETIITYMFGVTGKTDAYFVALTIPSLFVGLVSGSITSTFVTIYSSFLAKDQREQAEKTTNCILSIFFIIFLVLITILFIFSRYSINLIAPSYNGERLTISVQILRILLPNIVFGGLLGILTGVNNSNNSFLAPASVGLVLNISMIMGTLFLGKYVGIYALAISNSIAVICQFLIQIPSAKKYGLKFKFIVDINDKGLREMVKLVLPFVISALVGQLNLIIDRSFATSFSEGVVTSLYLSGKLVLLPQTIFGSALGMVILPNLVRYAANKNWKDMFQVLQKGLNLISFILLPFVIIFLTLSLSIITVLFQHGKFNINDTTLTASVIPFLIGVMFFGTVWSILNNVYYATRKVKYIVFTSIIAVISKIMLSYLLINSMKQWGLVLADSLSSFIAVLVMFLGLKFALKLKNNIDKFYMFKCNIKLILSSILMGITIMIMKNVFFHSSEEFIYNLIEIIVCSLVGVTVYCISCLFLKVEEIKSFSNIIKQKILKKTYVKNNI